MWSARPRLGLLGKFTVLTVAITGVLGAGLVVGVQWQLETTALEQAAAAAADEATGVLGGYLTAKDFAGPLPSEHRSAIEALVARDLLRERVVRVKIWNPAGVVVYSDDPEIVGRGFPIQPYLRAALDGRLAYHVSSLEEEEEAHERAAFPRLMEIYVPVRLANRPGVVGAYEVYQDLSALDPQIASTRRLALASIGGGFVLLYGVQFTLLRGVARRLAAQAARTPAWPARPRRSRRCASWTGSSRSSWPPSATSCARRSPRSRASPAPSARTTSRWTPRPSATSRARSNWTPTACRGWSRTCWTRRASMPARCRSRPVAPRSPRWSSANWRSRSTCFGRTRSRSRCRPTCRSAASTTGGSARCCATSGRTRSATRRRAAASRPRRGSAAAGWRWPSSMRARAFRTTSWRRSSRFHRAEGRGRGAGPGGMGLGLAICRGIVAAHGGRIWAENRRPGPGAAFRFTLPLAAAPALVRG